MSDIDTLNTGYGIAGELRFEEGPGGLARARIGNRRARASIVLQGAHLVDWTPATEEPVIWLSGDARFQPGKAIRGGVPVCWPWFGPREGDPDAPAHGFARTSLWSVVSSGTTSGGDTQLALELRAEEANRAIWPYDAVAEIRFTVGDTLRIELLTRNTGDGSVTIGDALHTYFAVGDVRQIALRGLEGREYIDKLDRDSRKEQSGPVIFGGETDRIYLDTPDDVRIEDPSEGRVIRIAKTGSRSTVVWNPWIDKSLRMGDMGEEGWLGMVCVESTNAADDVVTLAPGDEHRLTVTYRLEKGGR